MKKQLNMASFWKYLMKYEKKFLNDAEWLGELGNLPGSFFDCTHKSRNNNVPV